MNISGNLAFQGGSFFLDYSDNAQNDIKKIALLSNNTSIYNSKSMSDGGFFYLNAPSLQIQLYINKTTIKDIASNTLNV